jgi:hypothetical protein
VVAADIEAVAGGVVVAAAADADATVGFHRED